MRLAPRLLGALLLSGSLLTGCGGNNADDFVDTSFVFARAINATLDSPSQIFSVGPVVMVSNLAYGDVSGFTPFATFDSSIEIEGRLPDRSKFEIDVIEGISFRTNYEYTVISGGYVDAPQSFLIEQPRRRLPIRDIYLQFAHAASLEGDLEIYLTVPGEDLSGATPVANLGYADYTASEQIAEGEYQVRVVRASDGELVFDSDPLQFFRDDGAPENRGGHEWFFCILDTNQTTQWPVRALLTDGRSSFSIAGAGASSSLRVRHVDRGLGPVDVLLDGDAADPLATGLEFSQSSVFRALVPDDYLVSLTTPGQPTQVLLEETVLTSPGIEGSFYVVDPGSGADGLLQTASRRSVITEGRLAFVVGAPEGLLVSVYLGDPEDVNVDAGEYGGRFISRVEPPQAFSYASRSPGITVVTVTGLSGDLTAPPEDEEVILGPLEIDLAGGDVRTLVLTTPAAGSTEVVEAVLLDDL